jgi:hypothetical protein
VVRTALKSGIPGIADRELLGILWSGYDEQNGTFKIVFRTTQHRFHVPKMAAGSALIGVLVRQLDGNRECELCCVVSEFHVSASVPDFIMDVVRERIRERFYMYERVVGKWRDYYGTKK